MDRAGNSQRSWTQILAAVAGITVLAAVALQFGADTPTGMTAIKQPTLTEDNLKKATSFSVEACGKATCVKIGETTYAIPSNFALHSYSGGVDILVPGETNVAKAYSGTTKLTATTESNAPTVVTYQDDKTPRTVSYEHYTQIRENPKTKIDFSDDENTYTIFDSAGKPVSQTTINNNKVIRVATDFRYTANEPVTIGDVTYENGKPVPSVVQTTGDGGAQSVTKISAKSTSVSQKDMVVETTTVTPEADGTDWTTQVSTTYYQGENEVTEEITYDTKTQHIKSYKVTGPNKQAREAELKQISEQQAASMQQAQTDWDAAKNTDVPAAENKYGVTYKDSAGDSFSFNKNNMDYNVNYLSGEISTKVADDKTYIINPGTIYNDYYVVDANGQRKKISKDEYMKATGTDKDGIKDVEGAADGLRDSAAKDCSANYGDNCMNEVDEARERAYSQLDARTRSAVSDILGAYLEDLLGPPSRFLSIVCGDRLRKSETNYKTKMHGIPVPKSKWETELEHKFYNDIRTGIVFGEVDEITETLYRYEATVKIIGDKANPEWRLYFRNSCDSMDSRGFWEEKGQVGYGQIFEMLYAGQAGDDMIFDCEEDKYCRFDEVCLHFLDEGAPRCSKLAGTLSEVCN